MFFIILRNPLLVLLKPIRKVWNESNLLTPIVGSNVDKISSFLIKFGRLIDTKLQLISG